jgi:hypothetical protein
MQLIQWKDKQITIYPPNEPELDPTGDALTEELNYSYTNLVVYMYEPDVTIKMNEEFTVIERNGIDILRILDVNTSTAYITEVENAPDGEWWAEKYFYTPEDGYTLNEYWVDPRSIENL